MKGKIIMRPRVDMYKGGTIVISKDPTGTYKIGRMTSTVLYERDQCVIEDYFESGHAWGALISELQDLWIETEERIYKLHNDSYPSAVKRRLMWNKKTIEFEIGYSFEVPQNSRCKETFDKMREKLAWGKIIIPKRYSQKQVDEIIKNLTPI